MAYFDDLFNDKKKKEEEERRLREDSFDNFNTNTESLRKTNADDMFAGLFDESIKQKKADFERDKKAKTEEKIKYFKEVEPDIFGAKLSDGTVIDENLIRKRIDEGALDFELSDEEKTNWDKYKENKKKQELRDSPYIFDAIGQKIRDTGDDIGMRVGDFTSDLQKRVETFVKDPTGELAKSAQGYATALEDAAKDYSDTPEMQEARARGEIVRPKAVKESDEEYAQKYYFYEQMQQDITKRDVEIDAELKALTGGAKDITQLSQGNKQIGALMKEKENLARTKYTLDRYLGSANVNRNVFGEGSLVSQTDVKGLLPIAGTLSKLGDADKARQIFEKYEKGEDLDNLEKSIFNKYLAYALDSRINYGLGANVGQMMSELPTFAVEFALTGGIAEAGKAGLEKVATKIGSDSVARAVTSNVLKNTITKMAAGAAAQTAIGMSPRVALSTVEYMIPNYDVVVGEKGDAMVQQLDKGDDFTTALIKGYGTTFVESFTEQVGALVEKPMDFLKKATLGKYASKLAAKSGQAAVTPSALSKALEQLGWNGIIGEVFEEELGELMQAPIEGREYKSFDTPEGRERLLVEILGIAAFGGIARVPNTALAARSKIIEKFDKSGVPTTLPLQVDAKTTEWRNEIREKYAELPIEEQGQFEADIQTMQNLLDSYQSGATINPANIPENISQLLQSGELSVLQSRIGQSVMSKLGKQVEMRAQEQSTINRQSGQSTNGQLSPVGFAETATNQPSLTAESVNGGGVESLNQTAQPVAKQSIKQADKQVPSKEIKVDYEELPPDIQKIYDEVGEAFGGRYESNLANVLGEMDVAQAGSRMLIDDNTPGQGTNRQVIAQQSSFPKWVPEKLRSKALFNQVMEMFNSNTKPKPNTKAAELYELVADEAKGRSMTTEIQEKLEVIREAKRKIKEQKEQKRTVVENVYNNTLPTTGITDQVTVDKVTSQLTPAKQKQLTQLNQRLFGDTKLRVVEQLITPEGQKVLGRYQQGWIDILDGQAEAESTFYHEAVHKAFDLFLEKDQKKQLIDDVVKFYGQEALETKWNNYEGGAVEKYRTVQATIQEEIEKFPSEEEFFLRMDKDVREYLRQQGVKSQEAIKNYWAENYKGGQAGEDVVLPEGETSDRYSTKNNINNVDDFITEHTVYHGGDADFIDNRLRSFIPDAKRDTGTGGNLYGLSTSTSYEMAKDFSTSSTSNAKVAELFIDPLAKTFNLTNKSLDDLSDSQIREIAKNYDVIRDLNNIGGENEVRVLNPSVLVEREQVAEKYGAGNQAKYSGAQNYGVSLEVLAEEQLAEDFIQYAKTLEAPVPSEQIAFTTVDRNLNSLVANSDAIKSFYSKLLSGGFNPNSTETMQSGPEFSNQTAQGPPVSTPESRARTANQPIQSDGKIRASKAYTRVTERLGDYALDNINYNRMSLAEDAAKAIQFLQDNPEAARRVSLGLDLPPEGITETAISIAMSEKALTDGDYQLASQVEASRSLRQTRRGQEIVAERGRFNENSTQFFVEQVLKARMELADQKGIFYQFAEKKDSKKARVTERIKEEAKRAKKTLTDLKIDSAQSIIDALACK